MRKNVHVYLAMAALILPAAWASAQDPVPATIEVSPSSLRLKIGETAELTAVVKDAQGNVIEGAVVLFISRSRRALAVTPDGEVTANSAGDHTILALVPRPVDPDAAAAAGGRRGRGGRGRGRGGAPASLVEIEVAITVPMPDVTDIRLSPVPDNFYQGTMITMQGMAWDETNEARPEVPVAFSSSDASVATVSPLGHMNLVGEGEARITATAEGASVGFDIKVAANPIRTFELTGATAKARTGDVVNFQALAKDASGRPIEDLPVHYAVFGQTRANIIAAGATASIEADGRFVAERSGIYTVMASVGTHSAMTAIEVTPRGVRRQIEIVGHGPVRDRRTSDLWVWTAPDGRDYAITGTHGAAGHAYFWDVTDPSNITRIAEIQVDARTVNDVKITEDGSIAVISREGASNRRNGIVLYDVSSPLEGITKIAEYDQDLTGGVHNLYIYNDHVYALSAGSRYDVIDISNPFEPFTVGRFELPGRSSGIHDVWVSEGVAYSSNWASGVAAVDIGGGGAGGSPENPVLLGTYAYPNGRNHAAFPYRSKSTGKMMVFAADESFPRRFPTVQGQGSTPSTAAGWVHVVEWDEWDQPLEVARYKLPESGTHNLWVEDDILYIAYYNGGLRIVDVSGEMLGDLYAQGREIAYWLPQDPQGYIPNAPYTWGPQPFKGHIYISDMNSGLWALKLGDLVDERITLLEDR